MIVPYETPNVKLVMEEPGYQRSNLGTMCEQGGVGPKAF